MFIEFSFSNFRSFREMTTLSMVAAKLKSKYPNLDTDNVFETPSGLKLLRSKAIFGANASGKSNVIRAMYEFIINSKDDSYSSMKLQNTWSQHFGLIHKDSPAQPVVFQYVFLCGNVEYRYGFEILDAVIKSEWLFGKHNRKEIAYFIKEGPDVHTISEKYFSEGLPFIEAAKEQKGFLFLPHALFLKSIAAIGGKTSGDITSYFGSTIILDGLANDDEKVVEKAVLKEINDSSVFRKEVVSLLNSIEVNVVDVLINELNAERELGKSKEVNLPIDKPLSPKLESTYHLPKAIGKGYEEIRADFEDWESAGTQKFFFTGALVLRALQQKRPLLIDELDAHLHPRLSHKIVDLFNNPETNPHGAQLIFVTHDVGLLKPYKLRRDQIAFVDKGKDGSSTLTTLNEFKGIRNDASYDKEYMQGAYGGVPVVNQMENVVAKSVKKNEPKAN